MKNQDNYRFPYEWILLLSILIVFLIPLVFWILRSISAPASETYLEQTFWTVSLRTSFLATMSAGLSVLLAWPIAIHWRFSAKNTQRVIAILLIVPLTTGIMARNLAWIGMGSNTTGLASLGLPFLWLQDSLYTAHAIVFVITFILVPFSFFMLIQGTILITPQQVYASRLLGLRELDIIRYLVLPISKRAAILAFCFNSAYAAGFFITPRWIGGGGKYNFISNTILEYVNMGNFSVASSLSLKFLVLIFIPILMILICALRLRRIMSGQ
jgi:putative spermidine/putrescine transport system permease protein